MKKRKYKDYIKASKYFSDKNNNLLEEEIESVEKHKRFLVWVQEFSKKIVVIVFGFYLIISIASLILVYLSFQQGIISGIDTLISETNETFRVIIGGYIIKSAAENSFKIAGNYFASVANSRLDILRKKVKNVSNMEIDINSSDLENQDFLNSDSGDTTY